MNPLPHDYGANLVIWAVVWSALLGWQALAVFVVGPLPPFASVVRLLRRWWPTRWAVLAAWIWLGWHLFVRTTY